MSKFFRANANLKILADKSFKSIEEGAYDTGKYDEGSHECINIRKSILRCPNVPLITEIKLSSPSKGRLNCAEADIDIISIACAMVNSGSTALSVLTQPYFFSGSIKHLATIRDKVQTPILMKDIIVSEIQIKCAKKVGADCVLLIQSIFDGNLAEGSIEKFSEFARKKGLNVLVEVHSEDEFKEVIRSRQKYDLIGINNRDLNTFEIDIRTTERLLRKYDKGKNIVVSESGISCPEEILFLKRAGADAFLVGTSIIESPDINSKVRELYYSF